MRVGTGYDIHRLGGGRPFLLGGVLISTVQGPVGHSDGDALWHAIIDALLGASGLGDIGGYFPPGEADWQGVASVKLADLTVNRVEEAGFRVYNVDATIILERPKLAPYTAKMRQSIAEVLRIAPDRVNIKAKTNEGLGALGRGRAVAAQAVVLLEETVGVP